MRISLGGAVLDAAAIDPLQAPCTGDWVLARQWPDGPTTLERALGDGVDLILLDLGLPELDGLEVCRRVRAGGYAVPVLILTARADEVVIDRQVSL